MEDTLKGRILATKRSFKTKEVKAFGQTIQLRQLSAAAIKDISLRQEKADPAIHNNVWWIIGTAFDPETGARVFDWGDAEGVNELFVGDVNDLAYQAIDLNAVNKTPEEHAKN